MMDYRDVIVLQDARAVRDNLAQELARRDFTVRSCGSLAGLRHLYAAQPSPLIVLTGESDDLACDAQSVRMAAPTAIVIALGTAADTAWRMHVMAAGADACHAASIDIAELTAILLSWGRQATRAYRAQPQLSGNAAERPSRRPVDHMESVPRAGPARVDVAQAPAQPASCHDGGARGPRHPRDAGHRSSPLGAMQRAGSPGAGWNLDASCRVLICPGGRTLLLTVAENGFLMRIASSEAQLARRGRRASTGQNPRIGEPSGPELDPRSMDVLVSRLRRKARLAGIELPLLAVRGCGYLFAEPLAASPSSLRSSVMVPGAPGMPRSTPRHLPLADSGARMLATRLLAA